MKTATTTLTIVVLNAQGEKHYLVIKPNIKMSEVAVFILLLNTLQCKFVFASDANSASLIINEPNYIASEIILFNNKYFIELGISEIDLVAAGVLIGDPVFWNILTDKEKILIRLLFSKKSFKEIGLLYNVLPKRIEALQTELLKIIRIKYPAEKLNGREQLRNFGIRLKVHVEEHCSTCNRLL